MGDGEVRRVNGWGAEALNLVTQKVEHSRGIFGGESPGFGTISSEYGQKFRHQRRKVLLDLRPEGKAQLLNQRDTV